MALNEIPEPPGNGWSGDNARRRAKKLNEKLNAKLNDVVRQFSDVDHLNPEAIVAFVDGEMEHKAAHRARIHVLHCNECRAEVKRVRGAADWVRGRSTEEQLTAPQDLIARLAGLEHTPPSDAAREADEDPKMTPQGDLMDRLEMVFRALKRNHGQ